ncbi:MAG: hypothetical protein KGN33_00745 [Paracoccaceae bacterium]|nr:hypothetical protein [Paracoccaceae bacterium]
MSDRMSKNDIEDVLSSIRRLVTEETQGAVQHGVLRQVNESKGPADRLVLTPDFRIAISDTGEAGAEDTTVAAEPTAGEGADGLLDDAEAGSLGSRLSVLEAAMSHHADDWDHLGGEPEDTGSGPIFRHAAEDEAAPEDAFEAEDLGAAEPDDWKDQPMLSARPIEPSPDAEEVLFVDSDDDESLDEEALRDLIRDMIREELQGELGERITRNVRKLVRAEINRALASRDLG